MLSQVVLSARSDRWEWELETNGEFTVGSTRCYIDKCILPSGSIAAKWCRLVPIKVKVHLWHVLMDKLPTMNNLDDKHRFSIGDVCFVYVG